ANIGFNCEVFSASRVSIGRQVLMAAYVYIIGGDHDFSDPAEAVLAQGRVSAGVGLSGGAWGGRGAGDLDGATRGRRALGGGGGGRGRGGARERGRGGRAGAGGGVAARAGWGAGEPEIVAVEPVPAPWPCRFSPSSRPARLESRVGTSSSPAPSSTPPARRVI